MNRFRAFSLVLPPLLLTGQALVFWLSARWLGNESGYLLGFGFYWLFWRLLTPRWLLGQVEFASILHDRAPLFSRANWLAALLWLTVTLAAVFMYAGEFLRAPLTLMLLAIPLPPATLNGFCEEILWHGLYTRLFVRNAWLGVLYPALGFALWHFAPQVIFPAESVIGFVLSTFFLALPYGFIAYKTGSAKWTAISHSLSGILALSGYLAPSLLNLLSR